MQGHWSNCWCAVHPRRSGSGLGPSHLLRRRTVYALAWPAPQVTRYLPLAREDLTNMAQAPEEFLINEDITLFAYSLRVRLLPPPGPAATS